MHYSRSLSLLAAALSIAAMAIMPSPANAQSERDIRLISALDALDRRLAAIERRLDSKSKQEADDAKAEVRQLKQQLGTSMAGRRANGGDNSAYMANPGRVPPIIGGASQWAGAFASISAGNQSLDGRERSTSDSVGSQTANVFTAGVLTQQTVANSTNSSFGNLRGDDSGVVFTGTFGYNVMVTDRVLFGGQGEYTHALQDVRLTGQSTFSSFQTSQTIVPPGAPTSFAQTSTFPQEDQLTNKWTASALGRLGVLVMPNTQVYALAGWSWGGFKNNISGDEGDDGRSFVLNGPTFGAGIERDFGWLRGFVQGKAIFYDSKTLTSPTNSSQSTTQSAGAVTVVQSLTNTGSERRKFSADAYTFTAGVTVPIDFR